MYAAPTTDEGVSGGQIVGRWIRRTPTDPIVDLPVARGEESGHECELPAAIDAGPRSIWECDCGLRWRIAVPHWRPLPTAVNPIIAPPLDLPAWVRSLGQDQDSRAG